MIARVILSNIVLSVIVSPRVTATFAGFASATDVSRSPQVTEKRSRAAYELFVGMCSKKIDLLSFPSQKNIDLSDFISKKKIDLPDFRSKKKIKSAHSTSKTDVNMEMHAENPMIPQESLLHSKKEHEWLKKEKGKEKGKGTKEKVPDHTREKVRETIPERNGKTKMDGNHTKVIKMILLDTISQTSVSVSKLAIVTSR